MIEAIFENPEAKRELYAAIEPRLKADALLTTNTSSIPLTSCADTSQRPAQFAGLHYFNPVALMPLVEIIRHDAMAPETEKRAGRVLQGDRQAAGAGRRHAGLPGQPHAVPVHAGSDDRVCGRHPGPGDRQGRGEVRHADGPDRADRHRRPRCRRGRRQGARRRSSACRFPPALATPPEPGKRGKKDGQGLYTWENGKPKKPEVPKDYVAPDDLEDRLILPLLNEAVACLHDGVVADADLLDAGVIFGTGFAPFRGGPIQYIRDTGADASGREAQGAAGPLRRSLRAAAGLGLAGAARPDA